MNQDEEEIRRLIATWNERSSRGDVDGVLSLMTDDVVFSVVGRAPFGKREFAATSQQLQGTKIHARAEVQEVSVRGDVAWSRVALRVTMTPPDGKAIAREGHVMSIYTRQGDGRWLLARDANLLGPPR